MEYTTNYNIPKPSNGDPPLPDPISTAMDIIDQNMKQIEDNSGASSADDIEELSLIHI